MPGTNGGYSLSRSATDITAFEVIRAIDGPLFITSCITIHGTCDLAGHCTIKEPLRKVNDSIKDLLSGIKIGDLIETEPVGQVGPGAPVAGGLVSIALLAFGLGSTGCCRTRQDAVGRWQLILEAQAFSEKQDFRITREVWEYATYERELQREERH